MHSYCLQAMISYKLNSIPLIPKRWICLYWPIFLLFSPLNGQEVKELVRFSAPNATQAVSADKDHIYTISNTRIIKRAKSDQSIVDSWEGDPKGPISHLNSGYIEDGIMYCASSNYPKVPMASSIEIFDLEKMQHIGNHSWGIYIGSCTWIDRVEDYWYAMFVHYENYAQEGNKGVAYTSLLQFDSSWRRISGWTLPDSLIKRLKPLSISGGIMLTDSTMLLSPHHYEELYEMQIPNMGTELIWKKTIDVPFQGQGFAVDPTLENTYWGIHRKNREVIQIQIRQDP